MRPTRTKRCGTTKPASNIRNTASPSMPLSSTTRSAISRSHRRGQLFVPPRLQRAQGAPQRRRSRTLRPPGRWVSTSPSTPTCRTRSSNSTIATGSWRVIGGIREGQSPADRAEVPDRRNGDLWGALQPDSTGTISGNVQHIGNRFGEPGDQVPGADFVPQRRSSTIPPRARSASGVNDIGSLRLPAYTLAGLSPGVQWDSGLEVVALCEEHVRRESEAVARPRARPSCPLRLQ